MICVPNRVDILLAETSSLMVHGQRAAQWIAGPTDPEYIVLTYKPLPDRGKLSDTATSKGGKECTDLEQRKLIHGFHFF